MKIHITSFTLMLLLAFAQTGYAQATYKILDTKDIDMKLSGTSTFHDWEMEASKVHGAAQFVFKSGNEKELTSLKSLTFTLAVKDLKSDKKKLDNNAYKALKTEEYEEIHYQLSAASVFPEQDGYLLKTTGNLTVSGITKVIEMNIHLLINENNTITCKGGYELNMSDYDVEPPTFMMGLMKTGDALTLEFEVIYKKQNEG